MATFFLLDDVLELQPFCVSSACVIWHSCHFTACSTPAQHINYVIASSWGRCVRIAGFLTITNLLFNIDFMMAFLNNSLHRYSMVYLKNTILFVDFFGHALTSKQIKFLRAPRAAWCICNHSYLLCCHTSSIKYTNFLYLCDYKANYTISFGPNPSLQIVLSLVYNVKHSCNCFSFRSSTRIFLFFNQRLLKNWQNSCHWLYSNVFFFQDQRHTEKAALLRCSNNTN